MEIKYALASNQLVLLSSISKAEQIEIEKIALRLLNGFIEYFEATDFPMDFLFISDKKRKIILKDKPVDAFTTVNFEGRIQSLIVIGEDLEILRRVIIHEYAHSYRLRLNGIITESAFFRYMANLNNLICEELIASSVEKLFNTYLTVEELACFEYNQNSWSSYSKKHVCSDTFYKNVLWNDGLDKWIVANEFDERDFVCYIVYDMLKKTDGKIEVLNVLHLSSKDIKKILIGCLI